MSEQRDKMTFALAVSGSGGHIIPAVKVAEELIAWGHSVVLTGDFRSFASLIERKGLQGFPLDVCGYSGRSPLSVIKFLYKMLKSFFHAFHLLRSRRPDCVIGFGGYGSVPAVLAAVVQHIPTLIHEQNVYPGKATRLLRHFVQKIAVSFQETQRYIPSKTVLTGCPGHTPQGPYDTKQILDGLGLKEGLYTILVLGGSQGSQRINNCWLQSVPFLLQRMDYQVIHIAGEANYSQVLSEYRRWKVSACVLPFYEHMDQIYCVSQAVIARAGAASVTEFLSFQLPAILVPYPYAGGHQMENAKVLRDAGLATVVEEKQLSKEALVTAVETLRRSTQTRGARDFSARPGAGEKLADEILQFAGKSLD